MSPARPWVTGPATLVSYGDQDPAVADEVTHGVIGGSGKFSAYAWAVPCNLHVCMYLWGGVGPRTPPNSCDVLRVRLDSCGARSTRLGRWSVGLSSRGRISACSNVSDVSIVFCGRAALTRRNRSPKAGFQLVGG